MIKKIDVQSEEYQYQLEKTIRFTDKVINQFNFAYHPDPEITESIQQGLTRNKMIYDKYYCPCFMVQGETAEERKAADNRICPCKPALEKEIPGQGYCHCGIFCTPEYADTHSKEMEIEKVVHTHSRGLSKEECALLLQKPQLDSDEIESLLEARELGFINFQLVDVREWMEWVSQRIVGTDHLVPTTSFYDALEKIKPFKDEPIVLYCFTGSRSAYCQQVMKQLGFKQVSNFTYGIISYKGATESGE